MLTAHAEKLRKRLFEVFEEFWSSVPSAAVRDKSGEHKYMEIEVLESGTPGPFPCYTAKCWPNGKG